MYSGPRIGRPRRFMLGIDGAALSIGIGRAAEATSALVVSVTSAA